MDSSYDLDTEILDNLYRHQLTELREFTLKLDDTQDINLCRKWLQVFNKTSEDEKVSRNCLCALLCQQLKNDGCLSMPFTDLSNCNRDLTQVLASLDQTYSNESNSLISIKETESDQSVKHFQRQEDQIVNLKLELQQIKHERDEKEMKIRELTRIVEKCNKCELENDIIKNISDLLDRLKGEEDFQNIWIFRQLFAEKDNLEQLKKLTELDKAFQKILEEKVSNQLLVTHKQLRKIIRSREKTLKKYEKELCMQRWQEKMKVKVVKLKFCSILSRIFLKSREISQNQMYSLMDELEAKYRDILIKYAS